MRNSRLLDSGPARPGETENQRLDRNLAELLQELRVAQAGVQILFAFLLTLPFTQRWARVDAFERGIYTTTLLLTTSASVFLIGPVAYHRTVFHRHARERLVRTANGLAIAGLGALGLAMCGAVLFVSDYLFGAVGAVTIGGGTLVAFVVVWVVIPFVGRHEQSEASGPPPASGAGRGERVSGTG